MHNKSPILLLLIGLSACTADEPPGVYFDGGRDGRTIELDLEQRCPPVAAIAAPTLSQGLSQTANQNPYPLRGQAPGSATLIVVSGTSRFVGNVGTDGNFCIELQLQADMPNQIDLIPRTATGCPGPTTRALVTHRTLPSQDAGSSPTVENRARGMGIDSGSSPKQGALTDLNDGISTNNATLEMWDPLGKNLVWIRIDLGRSYLLSRIRIVWGPSAVEDESFASHYAIVVSNEQGAPAPDQPGWTVVYQEPQASGTTQEIHFSPIRARAAALLLYEDGGTNYLGYETFSLAELEVYGQDPDATPPPRPDSCL